MPDLRPLRVGDNRVPVYYAGGSNISAFRGSQGITGPEDWVGSLSALPAAILPAGARQDTGVSRTEEGESLRDLVTSDADSWLGPRLAHAFGGESALLVKLLDAGERLPVHCHPTRSFARRHLSSVFGKTEGWVIMAADPAAKIWLGMRDGVDRSDLRRWIDTQDVDAMLASMNELTVTAGQVVYVPSGLPHSIGPGVMLTELQEPTLASAVMRQRWGWVGTSPWTASICPATGHGWRNYARRPSSCARRARAG
jgi:mannose-6-phosphate isomerase